MIPVIHHDDLIHVDEILNKAHKLGLIDSYVLHELDGALKYGLKMTKKPNYEKYSSLDHSSKNTEGI